MKLHPVIFGFIPDIRTTYRVRDGLAEAISLTGSSKGSVPLKGASFSPVGGGPFKLGVGDIRITGSNNEVLVWNKVSGAKSVAARLREMATSPGHSVEQRPDLRSAKKNKTTDFGPLSQNRTHGPRKRLSLPVGTYFDNGDGTVTHEETRLTWIRAPWGMVWNGNGFDGDPIMVNWRTATSLFGKGAVIGFCGAELTGDDLRKSDYANGYTPGRCAVAFAGFSDWRLPTASELDRMAAYFPYESRKDVVEKAGVEPWVFRNWMWNGLDNRAAMQRLYPEWTNGDRKPIDLWTATGVGVGMAYAFDGRFPVGDHETHREFGVILVRQASGAEYASSETVDDAIDYELWTISFVEGKVQFPNGSPPKVGDKVVGGDLFAHIHTQERSGPMDYGHDYTRSGVIEEISVSEGEDVPVNKRLIKVTPTDTASPC